MLRFFSFIPCLALLACGPASGGERVLLGGDAHMSDSTATLSEPSPRDALLSGFTVVLTGKVEKDASAAGFSVDIDAPVGRDLYAAGFSLTVSQPVGEDVTAVGSNIHVQSQASIGGNARLAAASIIVDSPVAGSLMGSAGSFTLNGTVTGDARLTAGSLVFGPNAKIGGALTYFAAEPMTIPPNVIAADRVHYEKLAAGNAMDTVSEAMGKAVPRFWPTFFGWFFGFLLTIAFLAAAGAALFAFAPRLTESLTLDAITAPLRSTTLGVLGLSMMIGLVPVSAMTLIGVPFIPVILLAAVVLWIAGYLLGAYAVAVRAAGAFRDKPSTPVAKVFVLILGLAVFAALNFVPVIGWLINLVIVFLGLGAIMAHIVRALAGRKGVANPDAASGAAPTGAREPGGSI
jgi:hypothetical protein